jgi:hypothetical protein
MVEKEDNGGEREVEFRSDGVSDSPDEASVDSAE